MNIRERIVHTSTLLTGMVLGATVMYVFDRTQGARRRAHARDKVVRAGHLVARTLRKRSRDFLHRAFGSLSEVRSSIRDRSTTIPDEVLVSRVRSQLGHVVSHPALLEIVAENGCVCVRGPVLEHEVVRIKDRLTKVRGVRDCQLDLFPSAQSEIDRISGSRGGRRIPEAV